MLTLFSFWILFCWGLTDEYLFNPFLSNDFTGLLTFWTGFIFFWLSSNELAEVTDEHFDNSRDLLKRVYLATLIFGLDYYCLTLSLNCLFVILAGCLLRFYCLWSLVLFSFLGLGFDGAWWIAFFSFLVSSLSFNDCNGMERSCSIKNQKSF